MPESKKPQVDPHHETMDLSEIAAGIRKEETWRNDMQAQGRKAVAMLRRFLAPLVCTTCEESIEITPNQIQITLKFRK